MFQFSQEFEQEYGFQSCVHLRDKLDELGMDTSCAFGLSEDMEQEQLQAIEAALKAELEQAKQEREAWACHIGPYAGGICTICGGREP